MLNIKGNLLQHKYWLGDYARVIEYAREHSKHKNEAYVVFGLSLLFLLDKNNSSHAANIYGVVFDAEWGVGAAASKQFFYLSVRAVPPLGYKL